MAQGQQLGGYPFVASRSEFDIFDRNPDPALDELTGLAAVLSGADFAYMGWMDSSRLWFKARYGFQGTEQSRSVTADHWTLESGQALLIRDAWQDSRFPPEGIDLAGVHYCRSYVGVPLITGAQEVVGTLAILSLNPDQFGQEHINLVEMLARQVVTRLEL